MTSEVKPCAIGVAFFTSGVIDQRRDPAHLPARGRKIGREALAMDASALAQRYVEVWNADDAARRRDRIRALWAVDGTTCHRLLEARGYEAIEARVTGAWERWRRGGAHLFRVAAVVGHHGAVKCDWVMATLPSGDIAARGLSFLLLGTDGRLAADYQFDPTIADAEDLAARHLACWNERDGKARHRRIAELWRPDAVFIGADGKEHAVAALDDATSAGPRERLVSAERSQHHHHVAALHWRRETNATARATTGADLLIFDESGRIRTGYRFDDSI
jgi:hypothetical protein